MRYTLSTSIQGPAPLAVFDSIVAWPEYATAGEPERASVGLTQLPPSRWKEIRDAGKPIGGMAFWDDFSKQIATRLDRDLIILEIPSAFSSVSEALARILPLPFFTVELGAPFPDVWRQDNGYDRWSLAGGHIDHGWGCLFRGAGHDRLVSRRWLDFGPWRVAYLPNDTTFIQFYDLALSDPLEAYKQAKDGHQRIGVDQVGGYIQAIDTDVFSELGNVVYYKKESLLEIVIPPGAELTQRDMMIACELRFHDRLTDKQEDRVRRIAYVFINRSDAELHLHELWLRELECWYVDEHGKHRLDLDYHPTPHPPAWVAKLSANPVNALPEGLG